VLVHRDWVFENAPGRRGVTVRRALRLSPLSAWGGVTTVIRMRDRPLG
jgi:hypothetical protein